MKKFFASILCLGMIFGATGCTSGGDDTYEIAMITDSGSVTDKSFNQSAYEGVKEFGENANIIPPFTCDYGCNVKVGNNTVINHSGVFLDTNEINIGKHALIGPKSGLYGAIHPFDVEARNEGIEKAKTINIGDGAWLGGKVTVVPGVSIGKHSVIGAGSVVTKDIPDDVVAVGNPCRVIRKITEDDKINPIRKK